MQKIIKWLDNYWYHYKWVTIVAIFLVLVIGIGIFQMCTKEDYDIDVLYTGPAILNADQKRDLAAAFASVMSDDYNDDGEKTVMINDITVLSDDQLEEKKAEAAAESDWVYYDYKNRENAINNVTTLITTGETVICLMDDYMYQKYKSQNAFLPLSDLFESVPEYALDEYSVYLSDTPFGKYFSACMALPADTLLCIRRPSVLSSGSSKKAAEAQYQLCVETFKCLFTFSVGE